MEWSYLSLYEPPGKLTTTYIYSLVSCTANANVQKMEFFRPSPEYFRIILVWHSVRVFVGMYPFILLESIGQFTYYMHKVHCTHDIIVVNPALKYFGQFLVRKVSWVIHCDMTLWQKISEITFAVYIVQCHIDLSKAILTVCCSYRALLHVEDITWSMML